MIIRIYRKELQVHWDLQQLLQLKDSNIGISNVFQSLQRREALHESYDVSANLKQAAHSQIEYPILKSCLETLFFWPKNYGEKNTCTNWNLTVIPLSDLKWHKCLRIMENKSLPSLTNYVKDGTRNILGGISSTWACSNSSIEQPEGEIGRSIHLRH